MVLFVFLSGQNRHLKFYKKKIFTKIISCPFYPGIVFFIFLLTLDDKKF